MAECVITEEVKAARVLAEAAIAAVLRRKVAFEAVEHRVVVAVGGKYL